VKPTKDNIYAAAHAKLVRQARYAAKDAFENDRYGNGKHDWQSAEVAACNVLQDAGMSNDDAYEVGREIAGEVVSEIEDEEYAVD